VQSFIAQARKTQDLWAGSRILSELIEAGMKTFGEQNVIFPNPTNSSKPNRFLGKIENCDDLKCLGEKVEKAVRDKFKELAEKALSNAKASKPKDFDTQIENHLEVFWLFEPIEDNSNEAYKKAYKNIEQNLGAIKNVRVFKQMPETGRKCSLDGTRNALFFGKGTNKAFWESEKWNKNTGALELSNTDEVKVAKGEGLSAVSLTKRFYGSDGFPSTAKIALMQDIHNLENSENQEAKMIFTCYKKFFSDKDFDEQLLFEENLNENYFKKHNLDGYLSKLPNIIQNHAKIKKYLKTRYYALLVFDGDNMGKWLSGVNLKSNNLENFHTHLSKKLGDFAQNIDTYLQGYHFKTVYAGGDDYLGFVNLHSLFDVLQTLRQKFKEEVSDKLKEWKKDNETITFDITEELTFSAGICIAHYKTPLDIVLKTAKAMEHKAKEEGGRDAFAISVLKHSGESHETVLKWENACENLIRIKEITESLQKDFSAKWIKNIQEEFMLIANKDNKLEIAHHAMFKTEMKRLLGRSCNLIGKEKTDKVNEISGKAEALISNVLYHFGNFSEALNIAKFIQKELKN
jgi:CRISPR-associated protein Cmr2